MSYSNQAERNVIDLSDPGHVLWWCKAFSVTREELWHAVRTVGNKPRDVGGYLRMETVELHDH